MNSNRRDIDNIISELENEGKSPGTEHTKNIRKEFEDRFFDINKRLEEYRKNLLDEIKRVENKRNLPPPPQMEGGSVRELREEMLSRIRGIEKELYELRKMTDRRGAMIVE
mgnify:FL=1